MSAVLQRKVVGTEPGAVEVLAVEDDGGTGSASRQIVENVGKDQLVQKMSEYFFLERVKAKKFLEDAKKDKQEGIQGQCQQESFAKEVLDQVERCADTDSTPTMMRFGYYASKDGDWEEYKVEVSATEWAFERIREAFEKVAKYEAGHLSIVQRIMLKSTDFLRRIVAPAGGQGGVTLSYLCSHCNCFPFEVHTWWASTANGDGNNKKKTHCSLWCANE